MISGYRKNCQQSLNLWSMTPYNLTINLGLSHPHHYMDKHLYTHVKNGPNIKDSEYESGICKQWSHSVLQIRETIKDLRHGGYFNAYRSTPHTTKQKPNHPTPIHDCRKAVCLERPRREQTQIPGMAMMGLLCISITAKQAALQVVGRWIIIIIGRATDNILVENIYESTGVLTEWRKVCGDGPRCFISDN